MIRKPTGKPLPRAKGFEDDDSDAFDNEVDSYEEEYPKAAPKV